MLKGFGEQTVIKIFGLIEGKIDYLKGEINKKADSAYVDTEIQKLRKEILEDVLGNLTFRRSDSLPDTNTNENRVTFTK